MPALHQTLRKQLEKTVIAARDIAEDAAREALKGLAVDQAKPFDHMTPDERELRKKLRAKARQLGDRRDKAGKQAIDHLAVECAYEHWHRMLFARFLAENHLLIHDEEGVPVSLEECEELAKDEGIDGWTLAARFASRMLPQIFRPDDPVLAVTLAPESKRALEKMLDTLPPEVFTADDSLGWVYQFWQDKRKDEVNASGVKIGADELPAVTQLFTEHYMVLFLLQNTLGAWWAGKVLQTRDPDQSRDAEQSRDREGADTEEHSEEQWRKRVALPGCDFDYLRFLESGTPAAGTFSGWPTEAKDLKILDPCCGSGHFLVAAFDLMVRIRIEEDGLSARDACDAVLHDNIFGLEIDQRCTQIAAFALALAAWRFPEAGGYRELPELHIACCGIGPHATEEQWLQLAEQTGMPRSAHERELVERALVQLHELFSQAPTLGSLINPQTFASGRIAADYETLQPYLAAALTAEHADDETHERAVAAAGMVKAAELLASEYTLVVTNVPYLSKGRQGDTLKAFCAKHYTDARMDLATVFIERCQRLCVEGGCAALVTPQYWLFLSRYRNLRRGLLCSSQWNLVGRLGTGAFDTIGGAIVNVALVQLTSIGPKAEHFFHGVDASDATPASAKAKSLRYGEITRVCQADQITNPESRVTLGLHGGGDLLSVFANSYHGISTTDYSRFGRCFWEIPTMTADWEYQQSTVRKTTPYGGREHILHWQNGAGGLKELAEKKAPVVVTGREAWGNRGVAVSQTGALPVTLYTGELFDDNTAVIVPKNDDDLLAIWAFCSSSEYAEMIRAFDQSLKVTYPTLAQVEFDYDKWKAASVQKSLPELTSDDATQWVSGGAIAEARDPLQVTLARLLGYLWAKQESDVLGEHVDDDGIVCIPAVRGEQTAADRVRGLLAAAYGNDWTPAKQEELLASVGYGGKSLDEWLRDGFFEQHCKLFHHRPFIWHIWDGRKKDGFGALVNYHMLDNKLLDRLIYTYLGDWIKRQEQAVAQNESGADARLLAAQQLQEKLKLIAEGEPPYDIFVRWKPIEDQAIGWNPDLNDGVRMNIRPFMEANILRKKPNIKWKKDRGKEPQRPREQYPWFYDENGEPTGDRVNDVHLTIAEKQAARERAGEAEIQQTA